MAEESLKSTTKRGLIWSAIEKFGTQGVSFIFAIILARLLSPEAYGIVAMPMVFLALAQVFIDSGFSSALIRKPDLTEKDLSTAFYFNIIIGFVCYIILFFASPFIADFYNTPILSDLLKVSALATIFNPLGTAQQTILTKKIDFKTQARISLIASIIAGIIGIWMAYYGFGVWALVTQQVGLALVRVILLWKLSPWRPNAGWSSESFHYLWNYGSKMLASGILDKTYNNIYPIVIGKFYSAESLGIYSRAQHFADLPSMNITAVLQQVTFPVLSSIQTEDERLAQSYRKLLKLSAFVVFPLMSLLVGLSDPLIRILLGEKWTEVILLLQIICVARIFYPIHAINLNLLQVKGRSDLFLRLEIIKKIVGIIIMIYTIPRGLVMMASGLIVSSVIALVINTYYTGKFINVGYTTQMKDIMPTLLICISMTTIMILINNSIPNVFIQLIASGSFGCIFYIINSKFFQKEEFDYALSLIRKNG